MPHVIPDISEPVANSDFGDFRLHILPASQEMADRLAEILTDHRVALERRSGVLIPVGPEKHARIVALLRQLLSERERRQVQVFTSDGRRFPVPRLLDEWWRVHETGWFTKALSEDRFVTWFQPVVDTSDLHVIGHECLIRLAWGRIYSGSEILDAAWVRDEMSAFDAYARDLALRSAAAQSTAETYFVNLMPASIHNPDLCLKNALQTVSDSGLAPHNIVFEVVESELVSDRTELTRTLDLYRRNGFRIALDDFGPNPDFLQLLSEIQPDFIKLSRDLVRNLERPLYGATVRKLAELSERYGVTVVAKGVERVQTMENLWLLGIQAMQGYLFGRPAPQLSPVHDDLVSLSRALRSGRRVTESVH